MAEQVYDHPRPILCTCGHPFGQHDSASPVYACLHCACPVYATDWPLAYALGFYPAGGGPDVPHYRVGSLAFATQHCGPVAHAGEAAVCYEVATVAGRPSFGFIFERGGYDGFSPNEAALLLRPLGVTRGRAAAYAFEYVGKLERDFRAGLFDPAIDEARRLRRAALAPTEL